jgi:RES domain-containing protein
MAFRLSEARLVFRIGHRAYPLWDGVGAATCGGRWNPVGTPVVYASAHYSLALLEILANLNSRAVPRSFVRGAVLLPKGCSAERIGRDDLPNWDFADQQETKAAGARWAQRARALLLFVPSVVVEGLEENVLINPGHPEFDRLQPRDPEPVRWDQRFLPRSD